MAGLTVQPPEEVGSPSVLNPGDNQTATQVMNNTAGQYEYSLNSELNKLDRLNLQSYRSQIVANEAQHQADLALPEAMTKIQGTVVGAINTIAANNEAQRKADELNEAKSYAINTGLQFQNDFQQYQQQAQANMPANGQGYALGVQGFINDQIKNYMDNAPSQTAKLDVYEKLSNFKLKAMSDAFNTETSTRQQYNVNQAAQGVDFLANQIRSNPTQYGSALSQLNDIGSVLKDNGLNDAQVSDFVGKAKSTFIDSQVKGILGSNNPVSALNILNTDDVKQTLDPNHYDQLVNHAATVANEWAVQQKNQADEALMLQAYTTNKLPAGVPGYDKVADQAAQSMLFNQLGDTSKATADSIPQIASSVATYFKTYNSGMGKTTKDIITSKLLTSQNPFEVAAYAMGINALQQDPAGGNAQVIKSLPEDAQLRAQRVAELASVGVDAPNAVNIVNQEMQAAKNPALKAFAEQQAAADKDTINNLVGSTLKDFWFSADPYTQTKVKEEAQQLYGANLLRYQNANLAQAAVQKEIAFKYAQSAVNSTGITDGGEYMEAAPELYYRGDVLKQFMNDAAAQKQALADKLGTDPSNILIKPIPNVTIGQSPSAKDYMYVDKSTGLRITTEENGQTMYPTFHFALDNTRYGKEIQQMVANVAAKRQEINSQYNATQDSINSLVGNLSSGSYVNA